MKLGGSTQERSKSAQRRRDCKFSSCFKNTLIYFNDAEQFFAFCNFPIGSYGSTIPSLCKIFIGDITHAGAKVHFPLFQLVRVRSRADDLRKIRIRSRRTVSFNVLLWIACDGLATSPGGAAAVSPSGGTPRAGENFVFCGHSVFVGSLSVPTVQARGRGEGRVGGA